MNRKSSETEIVQLQPDFEVEGGEGYAVRVKDFGNAGVKLELIHPKETASVLLQGVDVHELQTWLARSTAQPAMAMPIRIMEVLDVVKAENKARKFLGKSHVKILNQARRVISSICSLHTPSGKKSSLVDRALRRRQSSVPRKYRDNVGKDAN